MSGGNTGKAPKKKGNLKSPWKPGQSGNPSGVSKQRAQFNRLFERAMLREIEITKHGKVVGKKTVVEAAIGVLIESALKKKERWAIEFICERIAPKTLNLDLASADGVKIVFESRNGGKDAG